MNYNFALQKVIQYDPIEEGNEYLFERILWIDPPNNLLFVINISDTTALPEEREISDIISLIEDGHARLLDFFIDNKCRMAEEKISPLDKDIREKSWNRISNLVKKEPDIYYKKPRGTLVAQSAKIYKTSKSRIYSYLRKYWQSGKEKNSLLPNYFRCGGKGVEKTALSSAEGGIKRGRNRNGSNEKAGINITKKERKIFQKAISSFYGKTDQHTLSYAYEMMICRDFIIGYEIFEGEKIPILVNEDKLPTFKQFKYWTRIDCNLKDLLIKREGEKGYALRHREIVGRSTSQAFGPGSRYQIDATIASVYLVNSLNRERVIKRAVIYVVIDVFSRMVAGVYVGLEGPSWIGAMMALYNAATDKVEYCKQLGINIKKEDWPCEFTPEILTADRGELEGDKPDNLTNALDVDVEILPPYRADWKGIVERYFRTLDQSVILWLPGAVKKKFRERGEKDYRLTAKLTLEEFTKIVINCILFYNNHHRMKYYDKNEFLITDNVDPIPIKLWNWGMENTTGRLKSFTKDILMINLLPSDYATVTPRGIKYKNKYFYNCELAEKENWFLIARKKGPWGIKITYDPRDMKFAYLRHEDGMGYEVCTLLEASYSFKNAYLEETEDYDVSENRKHQLHQFQELQAKAQLFAKNNQIVEDGCYETDKQSTGISGKQKIDSIRDSTAEEKQRNRNSETFKIVGYSQKHEDLVNSTEVEYTYIPPLYYEE